MQNDRQVQELDFKITKPLLTRHFTSSSYEVSETAETASTLTVKVGAGLVTISCKYNDVDIR